MGLFSSLFGYRQKKPVNKYLQLMSRAPSYSTLRHTSHILLFDTETPEHMRELIDNAADIYKCFCDIYSVPKFSGYSLICAFPEDRTDLLEMATVLKSKMDEHGIKFTINVVKNSDNIYGGKQGLLACSQWLIAGVTLENNEPIPVEEAVDVLLKAT